LCPRHSNLDEEALWEEERQQILKEATEQEKETLPFGTWIIKRFTSRSDGRNKSKRALKKVREYSLNYPKSESLIIRRRVQEKEKVLIGVPVGATLVKVNACGRRCYKHRFYGFNSNSIRAGSLSKLDPYIDEEIREQNVDLDELGINAEDFFLMHISRVLKTKTI